MELILGIETSCDETAAAVVRRGREVLSDVIRTQIEEHSIYGGVVPEIASRRHIEYIIEVIDTAIKRAGIDKHDLDAVAVTNSPGLVGALLVGVSAAKAIAFALDKPLVGVNHIHAHIAANFIDSDWEPPFLCLVASGGHSHIVRMDAYGSYGIIGATRDDAAGEAFDKVARVLGLGYPGGPNISKAAKQGNADAVAFPRVKCGYDFSFSGVKTAVINHIHKLEQKGESYNKYDIAASFQQAVVDVLASRTLEAAKAYGYNKVCVAGGVAANELLRGVMAELCAQNGIAFHSPTLKLCTDNAAMVGVAGFYDLMGGRRDGADLNAVARSEITRDG